MLALATKFAPEPALFEMAHRAGYRCAELWLGPPVLARTAEVAALARSYPFRYALHFPNRVEDVAATLAPTVGLYRALDSACLVIHQPQHDRHGAALKALAPEVVLAVENHKLTPAGLVEWGERNEGLALDVEHLWKYTLHDAPLPRVLEELDRLLGRFAGKLRHVHLPGYLAGHDEHRPMYCSRDLVFAVLDRLQAIDFRGLIVSEINVGYQTPEDLRMDVLLFDLWRRTAGERRA